MNCQPLSSSSPLIGAAPETIDPTKLGVHGESPYLAPSDRPVDPPAQTVTVFGNDNIVVQASGRSSVDIS
jgi:hypothetical protein